MRPNLRSATVLGAVLILAALGAGCRDDGPTTPDGQPLVFSGQLEQGETVSHVLNLVGEGSIRIELTDLTPVLIQLPPEGELSLRIGVGLGDFTSGTCQRTFGTGLSEGESLSVLLTDPARCMLVFDNGFLPEDAVVAYTVTIIDLTQ